jgi:hypothetical protein
MRQAPPDQGRQSARTALGAVAMGQAGKQAIPRTGDADIRWFAKRYLKEAAEKLERAG